MIATDVKFYEECFPYNKQPDEASQVPLVVAGDHPGNESDDEAILEELVKEETPRALPS